MLGGTFTCRLGVFLPSFSLILLVSAIEPSNKGYFFFSKVILNNLVNLPVSRKFSAISFAAET